VVISVAFLEEMAKEILQETIILENLNRITKKSIGLKKQKSKFNS
jgi:hypothetical protein